MNRPAPLCGVSCKLTRRPCKTVQSTHPRGVRHLFEHGHQLRQIISTHAPREGCDAGAEGGKQVGVDISIHAPREGCDRRSRGRTTEGAGFQSTHPARGATASSSQRLRQAGDFNPRTPRGVRPSRCVPVLPAGTISIHAPREGCDARACILMAFAPTFQSTHPARGATR